MEIRTLRLVKAIVERGSLVKAAEVLHLSPSALSHQLKEAEDILGSVLFHRQGKKLVLTAAGSKVSNLAFEVLAKIEAVQQDLRGISSGEAGEIRISTECYTSYHWLPSLLVQFRTQNPRVEIKIDIQATHDPLPKILTGDLDVAITSDPIDDPRLRYIDLFQDEMVALVSAAHPWADRPYVRAEDFVDQTLIIHSLPLETVSVHQYVLAPAGVSPKEILVLPLTEAEVAMVTAGMGVTVMAKWALKPYRRDPKLKTVKVGPEGLKRTHYLATLKDRKLPAYLEQFIGFLREEVSV